MKVKVLLADDHRIFLDGLRSLLERQGGVDVVGEAVDGREAVRKARRLRPDVVIMDVSMPGMNGIEATRQIAGARSGTRVIALSMHSDRRFVAEMLKAGASAYILKDNAYEELERVIRVVAGGKVYLGTDVLEGEPDAPHRPASAPPPAPTALSPREREVLQLIAEGKTARGIATSLFVSVKTIETHRRRIMEKLDIDSVAGLTKYAIREGITSVED